ncbi:hypothetical protein [Diaminobutyricibacter sp. McL0608]|uniref:hypothetical protein n=1 Tax=Leifsonia sp. McL0608 TaxID=3143537 RepID=UPI0031F32E61
MKHRRLQTYADLGVDVVEISSSEWRVSLTDGDEAEPRSLLGFVQQVDGMFEVTEICRPGKRTYHRQFEAALAQLQGAPPLHRVLETPVERSTWATPVAQHAGSGSWLGRSQARHR